MRKIISIMLAILCLMLCSVSAFAAESSSESQDVYANRTFTTGWETHSVDENGKAEITMSDGTKVTLSGITNTDWSVSVEKIDSNEKEAWEWLNDMLGSKMKNYSVYYIFLTDTEGNTHSVNGITVSITLPNTISDPVGYTASNSGATALSLSASGKTLTFTTNGNSFYALGEKVAEANSNTSTNSPQTGDSNHLALWIALALLSGGALVGTSLYSKKKKRFVK